MECLAEGGIFILVNGSKSQENSLAKELNSSYRSCASILTAFELNERENLLGVELKYQ